MLSDQAGMEEKMNGVWWHSASGGLAFEGQSVACDCHGVRGGLPHPLGGCWASVTVSAEILGRRKSKRL